MADVHEPEVRSYNMSRIRSKNTKPEVTVRKYLHSKGLRFRIHAKELPGKPDIVLPKYKTIVLINGCFWHGHKDCKYFQRPKTRPEFWKLKIQTNKEKDTINHKLLTQIGWKAIVLWTCELKPDKLNFTLSNLLEKIRN